MIRTATLSLALVAALAAVSASGALAQEGTITSLPANPYNMYSGYSPYAYPYSYPDPLQGAAAIINAQGQLMEHQQNAFLTREKVRRARIDNRRAELEQFLWEREHMPTPEDDRQRLVEEGLRRARFGADFTEIWSAKALNQLLDDARKIGSPGADANAPPLGDEVLAKINVTSGKGNVGLLKDGKLPFPLLLKRPTFDKERERLGYLGEKAVQQASEGAIKPEVIEEMSRTVDEFQQRLTGLAREAGDNAPWSPTSYVEAKNFLNQMDDVVRALQSPDAATFLSKKYALKGKNIAEIVKFMIDNGLRFAPATEGTQAAYNALYEALRSYDDQAGSKTRDKR